MFLNVRAFDQSAFDRISSKGIPVLCALLETILHECAWNLDVSIPASNITDFIQLLIVCAETLLCGFLVVRSSGSGSDSSCDLNDSVRFS